MIVDYFDEIKYPPTRFRPRKLVNSEINEFLSALREHTPKGLHLGAGNSKIEGLTNCDLFNPNADLRVDSTNLSMFEDSSIDLIESHHMIEHLSFAETSPR